MTGSGCWWGHGAACRATRPQCHAVAWSHDHSARMRSPLLERCSVFTGGFDLESACAVGGSPMTSGGVLIA